MSTESPASLAKSGLEKANALFVLSQKPEAATERAWELYTANRQGAERFPGMKIQDKKMRNNEEGEADEVEEDDDDDMPQWGEGDDIYVLKKIRSTVTKIEQEMGLKDAILQRSFRVLSCDALFEEQDEVKILYLTSETLRLTLMTAPYRLHFDAYIFAYEADIRRCPFHIPLSLSLL
jgi:hypothetical protein